MCADRTVQVAVVGAGFAGIGVARRLRLAGVRDIVLLERGSELGGIWRDNDYPGCTCDIPSVLYEFSFAPNPEWTSTFAPRTEILAYLKDCARRWDLERLIEFDTELRSADWDERGQRWLITTNRGRFTAGIVVVATGSFGEPSIPDLPGLAEFTGPVFHSAHWRHDEDLTARRVAVIGTGASAIQIVPGVADKAKGVQVYQRTPPWVMPKRARPVGGTRRLLYRRMPQAQPLSRAFHYWSRELLSLGVLRRRWLRTLLERQGRAHLAAQVPDPQLRARLTPDYAIFCKRVLLSDDYYPALTRPHVEVVSDPITRIEPDRIVTADGTARPVDAIVLSTGFTVTDPPIAHRLFGTAGRSLAASWRDTGREAHLGTCVAGFPNLFLLTGPNSGTSHTSLLVMLEAQFDYVVDCVRRMNRHGIGVVEVRADAQRAFVARVRRAMTGTVWTTGGCTSYYLDATGRNTTLWPGPTWTFRKLARRFDVGSYRVRPKPAAGSSVRKEVGMDVRNEISALVRSFLSEVSGTDRSAISDDARLSDVEIDSLELVALVQALQRRYDVTLNDDRLLGLETVGQFVDFVLRRVESGDKAMADQAMGD